MAIEKIKSYATGKTKQVLENLDNNPISKNQNLNNFSTTPGEYGSHTMWVLLESVFYTYNGHISIENFLNGVNETKTGLKKYVLITNKFLTAKLIGQEIF